MHRRNSAGDEKLQQSGPNPLPGLDPVPEMWPATTAALYLGVTTSALHDWRRRGIGPPCVRTPVSTVPQRNGYRPVKPQGRYFYPVEGVRAFLAARMAPAGRLPRPYKPRVPGSANGPKL